MNSTGNGVVPFHLAKMLDRNEAWADPRPI